MIATSALRSAAISAASWRRTAARSEPGSAAATIRRASPVPAVAPARWSFR